MKARVKRERWIEDEGMWMGKYCYRIHITMTNAWGLIKDERCFATARQAQPRLLEIQALLREGETC